LQALKLVALAGAVTAAAVLPAGVASAANNKAHTPRPGSSTSFGPAASGEIAYISGSTLEVRNPEVGQTTVQVTSKTQVSATVAVTLKAVTVGSCITATGTKAKDGSLQAATVILTAGRAGNCAVRSGGERIFPGAASSARGLGASRATSRPHFSVPANSATAFGKVTSVSRLAIGIEGTVFSFSASRQPRSRATAGAALKPKRLIVTVSPKTRYLRTGPASPASLKVGECVTVFGTTNDIGAVTATRLEVSPATSSGCGFGGFGSFGRFGFGGASA